MVTMGAKYALQTLFQLLISCCVTAATFTNLVLYRLRDFIHEGLFTDFHSDVICLHIYVCTDSENFKINLGCKLNVLYISIEGLPLENISAPFFECTPSLHTIQHVSYNWLLTHPLESDSYITANYFVISIFSCKCWKTQLIAQVTILLSRSDNLRNRKMMVT
jgi:hypothetical protein